MKPCPACQMATEYMKPHRLDPCIVRVKLPNATIVNVVVWVDALHASCNPESVDSALAQGAPIFDWTGESV